MKILLISAVAFTGITIILFYLLNKYVNRNRRHPSEIKEGERFNFYVDGKLKAARCARNYADIEVIYTGRRRVEYKHVSKI